MKRLYYSDASDTPPSPPSNPATKLYPQDGNRSTKTMPTVIGAYWYYMITEEFMAVIEDAGLEPSVTNLHQLADIFADFKARASKAEGYAEIAKDEADRAEAAADGVVTNTETYIKQMQDAGAAVVANVKAEGATVESDVEAAKAALQTKLETLVATLEATGGEQAAYVKAQAQEILDAITQSESNAKSYASQAQTSASSAQSSATAAASSATDASDSADSASASATAAKTSETSAKSSATSASSSATSAKSSETAASKSASAASTSATAAKTSETNAAASATSAATAKADAETASASAQTAASQAKTAQTNAGNSATAAASSASAASTSATSASGSATDAKSSADSAASSATAAKSSASAAATSADSASASATAAAKSAEEAKSIADFDPTAYVKTADLPTALPNPQKLTFTGGASGSYDGSEAVSISIPSEGLSESKADDLYVRMVGGRMKLAGCEMCDSMSGVVDFNSPDAAYSDGTYIYVANLSDKETAYVKAVVLTGTSAPEISLGSKWSWRGGTVPAIEPGGMLVFCWIYDRGIATFIPGASS